MSEKIENKELQFLLSRTRNTLSEAIFVMEREGAKMLDIKKHGDVGWLTKMRMDVLHQKNNLKELYEELERFSKENKV